MQRDFKDGCLAGLGRGSEGLTAYLDVVEMPRAPEIEKKMCARIAVRCGATKYPLSFFG